MTIRYVEARNSHWADSTKQIIQKLKSAGAKKGQVLWIDAHVSKPNSDTIYSAYWDDNIKSDEELDIQYNLQDTKGSWADIYNRAVSVLETIDPKDVISVTGSLSTKTYSVLTVFYYKGNPVNRQNIKWIESRQYHWEDCANDIITQLKNNGAKMGQIISIDAHQNVSNNDAIIAAFWNASLPANGDLQTSYELKDDNSSWSDHYEWISNTIASMDGNFDFHSLTSSFNSYKTNYGVSFIFHDADDVLSVEYDLDNGQISGTKPLVADSEKNVNNTDHDQTLTFQYTKSSSVDTDNTSSFSNEIGEELSKAEFSSLLWNGCP